MSRPQSEGKQESLASAGARPTGSCRLAAHPHPAQLSMVGAATQISDNGQLPSLVLLRQDRRMPTYCWARCTEASVQAFWGMECH